ncbi:MAG: 6-phosphogluconolactonase [Verrucomicrobia bacterium]|nr:MAG: 6-phosphogluconolactonase [Verrucomicrobiota bacterium]
MAAAQIPVASDAAGGSTSGMPHSLLQFDDDEALSTHVAARWIDWIDASARSGIAHRVALPGGRITRKVLAATAAGSTRRGVSLAGVDIFWGDERCVAPDDPESNFRLAREALFEPASVPPARVYRIRGEIDPPEAAREAEAKLRAVAGAKPEEQPVLDLVFLGLGEDGHVASLFPGAPAEITESRLAYVPVVGPKPPPRRVSLTYAAIAAAREVWVLASGAGKQEALRLSLGAGSTPLARVIAGHPRTLVFTDIKAR